MSQTPTGNTHLGSTQPEIPSGFLQQPQYNPSTNFPSVQNPYAPNAYMPVADAFRASYAQQHSGFPPAGMGFAGPNQGQGFAGPNQGQGFVNNRHALPNDLGEGFSYENVAFIAKSRYSPQEEILANTLDAGWKPSGSGYKFPQRCPAIWTDNITIVYNRNMPEPMIALALWSKPGVVCFGKTTELSGLVSVGGGHYEAMGDKACGSYGTIKFEKGHISARVAADAELNEEVGVKAENVRHTRLLAVEDNVLGDQRKQGLRIIFGRWVDQSELKPSQELTKIVLIPLSQIGRLIAGEQYRIDGKVYGMILGHDKMLERVFKLPQWKAFLQEVAQFSQLPPAAYMGTQVIQ